MQDKQFLVVKRSDNVLLTHYHTLLLDEPCTNLDASGYALYHSLIKKFCMQKLIVVSSNDEQEFNFCDQVVKIMDYK